MNYQITNLLDETLRCLDRNGKTIFDVEWVGLDGKAATWAAFADVAQHVNYDSGYGCEEIPTTLVVVGADWWLSRGEYDGSEWWNFNSKPAAPEPTMIASTFMLERAA